MSDHCSDKSNGGAGWRLCGANKKICVFRYISRLLEGYIIFIIAVKNFCAVSFIIAVKNFYGVSLLIAGKNFYGVGLSA